MVGQEFLLNNIPKTLDEFPHTLLIEGAVGSGRHTLVKYICDSFKIEPIDFKELGIKETTINDLMLSPSIHICVLDLTGVSIKEQNVMLKFLEEPLNHCYIILLCETSSQVLPTVVNRCVHWKMEPYTKEQLKLFFYDYTAYDEYSFEWVPDVLFDYVKTPGDVLNVINSSLDINEAVSLINNIITNISRANFSNVLVLVDKIKEFNQDKGIIEFDMFLKLFFVVLEERVKNENNITLYNMYYKLQNLYELHKKPYLHLNEKQLYEKFLLEIKMSL